MSQASGNRKKLMASCPGRLPRCAGGHGRSFAWLAHLGIVEGVQANQNACEFEADAMELGAVGVRALRMPAIQADCRSPSAEEALVE